MVRIPLKLISADAVLLLGAYLVLQDLAWRSGYASQKGLAPSYFYSLLTQSFSMTGKGLALQSPLTLDWVQLIAVVLVVLNVWYLYGILRRRTNRGPAQAVK